MVDHDSKRTFSEQLIQQDEGISPTSLQEKSMKLQQTLDSLDAKARSSQRFTVISIASFAVCYVAGVVFNVIVHLLGDFGTVVAGVWMLCSWVTMITAAVALTRHLTVHRPRLEKGRTDLQIAMFQDLQRQLTQLSQHKD